MSTEELESSAEYRRVLEDWILCALNEGAKDFWDLVRMLPGAFPTDVREALDGLVAQRKAPCDLLLEAEIREKSRGTELEIPNLPAPHPLAFDWRFTRSTAGKLLDKAVAAGGRME